MVNIVVNRIPSQMPKELEGEAESRFDIVSGEKFVKVGLTAGTEKIVFHIDVFSRATNDYEIPGVAEIDAHKDEEEGHLQNSAIDTISWWRQTLPITYPRAWDTGYSSSKAIT